MKRPKGRKYLAMLLTITLLFLQISPALAGGEDPPSAQADGQESTTLNISGGIEQVYTFELNNSGMNYVFAVQKSNEYPQELAADWEWKWEITNGTLPNGLALIKKELSQYDLSAAAISGTPTETSDPVDITIQVTAKKNGTTYTGTTTVTIQVQDATVGNPYDAAREVLTGSSCQVSMRQANTQEAVVDYLKNTWLPSIEGLDDALNGIDVANLQIMTNPDGFQAASIGRDGHLSFAVAAAIPDSKPEEAVTICNDLTCIIVAVTYVPEPEKPSEPVGPAEPALGLTPGETYWFDLADEGLPGTVNANLPGGSLHWTPFTYVGVVNAYKLDTPMATTEAYAAANAQDRCLFIADYPLTHTVSWGELDGQSLIFGRDYASGGVNYTLRAPSVGSSSQNGQGAPTNNEWDAMLDKNAASIKDWTNIYSWGQDSIQNEDDGFRALRGEHDSADYYDWFLLSYNFSYCGFRPVLEMPALSALPDTYQEVTVDLGGGSLGDFTGSPKLAVSGDVYSAPSAEGLTPEASDNRFDYWQGDDGQTYAPGASVPAGVALTAHYRLPSTADDDDLNPPQVEPKDDTGFTEKDGKIFLNNETANFPLQTLIGPNGLQITGHVPEGAQVERERLSQERTREILNKAAALGLGLRSVKEQEISGAVMGRPRSSTKTTSA